MRYEAVIRVPEAAWSDRKERTLKFPAGWKVKIYPMNGYGAEAASRIEVLHALRNPIASKPLRKLAEGKREVAIVFDDITRPTRVKEIVDPVLSELKAAGVRDDHIRFIAALGAHGAMNRTEFAKKLGDEIVERYPVYNHNPFHGLEFLGETSRGTPVEVNGEYASCDLRIGIGCIVPHPMAGFGGGAKILLPGIASMNAIAHNHAVVGGYAENCEPNPTTGWEKNEGNVIRSDAEEFSRIAGLDFKVDVLINGFNESIGIYSGDAVEEQRAGVRDSGEIYSSDVPEDYDVVVLNASAKANEACVALSNWYPFLKEGSTVVLIANPPSGQVTHYAYGKFGKRLGGTIYNPPKSLKKIKKLIVYSEYPEADPLLPIARTEEILWMKSWIDVLEEVKSSVRREEIKVAIIPNADVQRPRRS